MSIILYESMRWINFFPTVKIATLYLVPMKIYSKKYSHAFVFGMSISIYSESFSFLSWKIGKLEKSGFAWEHIWSWWPETTNCRFETV
jgi:hypothetical protein